MKIILASVGGAIVAVLLFITMNTMIGVDDATGMEKLDAQRIDFIRVERDERVRERTRHLPEPLMEVEPPPPQMMQHRQQMEMSHRPQLQFDRPNLGIAGGVPIGPYLGRMDQAGNRDGDVMPLVRIEPQWPREALIQGVEGWVRVSFTITPEGRVVNARVVDSQPRRMFDRSALRAVEQWRFQPRIVDGRPVERQATQIIDFRLADQN
ncbi:protein TonB [Natronospira proteinivora]|uniref:Protein TonB n=1 Tax=Natronospira proteinivora TaxID=1807133 RepID=A0ABT1GAT4_9GAMM|nr:energy transducer TonB [Natronospira proteinivora]MCP1728428.1 protein TonB [Natronospira proteinivora]